MSFLKSHGPLQMTIAIIKSSGYENRREILRIILKKGFILLAYKIFDLTPEKAAMFYNDKTGHHMFSLYVYDLVGKNEVLLLSKENAINDLNELIGPEKTSVARANAPNSLRAIYGSLNVDFQNAIYGSENELRARRDIRFFFPNVIVDPIQMDAISEVVCQSPVSDAILKGIKKVLEIRPKKPVEFLKIFLENYKPYYFLRSSETKSFLQASEPRKTVSESSVKSSPNVSSFKYVDNFKGCFDRESTSQTTSNIAVCSVCNKEACICKLGVKMKNLIICPVCNKIVQFSMLSEDSQKSCTCSSEFSINTPAISEANEEYYQNNVIENQELNESISSYDQYIN